MAAKHGFGAETLATVGLFTLCVARAHVADRVPVWANVVLSAFSFAYVVEFVPQEAGLAGAGWSFNQGLRCIQMSLDQSYFRRRNLVFRFSFSVGHTDIRTLRARQMTWSTWLLWLVGYAALVGGVFQFQLQRSS